MANVKFKIYTKAMEVFKDAKQATVTPTQLTTAMGDGASASKTVWFLKKLGFNIQANKTGREVVSYTLLGAPDAAPEQKALKVAEAKKPKAPKAPKAPKVTKAAPAKAPKKPTPAVTVTQAAASKPKSPTARKETGQKVGGTRRVAGAKNGHEERAIMTEHELQAAAAAVDMGDVNELDDRSDLPEYLR